MTFEDLGHTKVDYDREARNGYPEIIYGESKTAVQTAAIIEKLLQAHGRAMATRMSPEKAEEVLSVHPGGTYKEASRLLIYGEPAVVHKGKIIVVSAGTSDLPVAEEAEWTAKWLGCETETVHDVGVAGIDRLLSYRDVLQEASVIITVAGMEGALPSVVCGLVKRPVLAVPTSVGYGAHFDGLTPLLSMLSSCSSGMSVVNIDNGFGAAYQAAMILKLASEGTSS